MYLVTHIRTVNKQIRDWLIQNWKNSQGGLMKIEPNYLLKEDLNQLEQNEKIMLAIQNILNSKDDNKFQQVETILEKNDRLFQEQFLMFFIYRYINVCCDWAQEQLSQEGTRKGTDAKLFDEIRFMLKSAALLLVNLRTKKEKAQPGTKLFGYTLTADEPPFFNETQLQFYLEQIEAFYTYCCKASSDPIFSKYPERGMIDCSFKDYTEQSLPHIQANREDADYCSERFIINPADHLKSGVLEKYAAFFGKEDAKTEGSCMAWITSLHAMYKETEEKRGYSFYTQQFHEVCRRKHKIVVHQAQNGNFDLGEHGERRQCNLSS